jgi:hypothetical protein
MGTAMGSLQRISTIPSKNRGRRVGFKRDGERAERVRQGWLPEYIIEALVLLVRAAAWPRSERWRGPPRPEWNP